MSITDELRKFAWKECPSKFLERVIDIADYIDQTHDKLIAECQDELLIMDIKLEKAARNTIPLPKDADGETIHIGDELEWLEGNRLTVNGIGDGGMLFYTDENEQAQWTTSGDKRHVQPDSWELIIKDAIREGIERAGCDLDRANGIDNARLVERCKRLAGEDA